MQERECVREDGLDAAPGVHHGAVAVEVILMEFRRNGDDRRHGDGVGFRQKRANSVEALADSDEAVRKSVIEALGSMGPEAKPPWRHWPRS